MIRHLMAMILIIPPDRRATFPFCEVAGCRAEQRHGYSGGDIHAGLCPAGEHLHGSIPTTRGRTPDDLSNFQLPYHHSSVDYQSGSVKFFFPEL